MWPIKFIIRIDQDRLAPSLMAIDALVESLRDLPLPPTARERIERLNIVRTVKGTTGLEGNQLSEEAVSELIDEKVDASGLTDDEREVHNAGMVMEYIKKDRDKAGQGITEAFIKDIHLMTTENIKNPWNEPGKYRRDQVFADIHAFPEPDEVPGLMKSYIKMINGPKAAQLPIILRALVAHYFFVTIHPFGDGNGRVARAIEAFVLYHGGYDAAGFYSLANFYYRNRKEYLGLLKKTQEKLDGELTEFCVFACAGFVSELAGLNKIALPYLNIVKYLQYIDLMLETGRISQRVGSVLKAIANSRDGVRPREFVYKIPPWAASLYRSKSERTIRDDLTTIRKSGLIVERDGRILPNLDVISEKSK
jgi:Fic family protein